MDSESLRNNQNKTERDIQRASWHGEYTGDREWGQFPDDCILGFLQTEKKSPLSRKLLAHFSTIKTECCYQMCTLLVHQHMYQVTV